MIAERDQLVDPADGRYWHDKLADRYQKSQMFDERDVCAQTWDFLKSLIADLEADVTIWEDPSTQADSEEATA